MVPTINLSVFSGTLVRWRLDNRACTNHEQASDRCADGC